MPGQQDTDRTSRILIKVLSNVLYKTIAFEEGVTESKVKHIKRKYIREKVILELNQQGVDLMNGRQLDLLLEAERKARYEILHRLGKDNKKDTWDQGI